MLSIIQTRAKQLFEIDCVLFDRVDLPVFIPDVILDSQKALTKKVTSPSKKKQALAAAKEAAASTDAMAETGGMSLKLSPEKMQASSTTAKGSAGSPATGSRRSKAGLGLRGPLASMLLA